MCLIVKTYYHYFPGTGNNIASDIINAVSYLHQNDIVHRDIKPGNLLVNNHYYSSLNASRLNAVFQEQPIVCKLGILVKQGPLLHKRAWSQGIHIHALLLEVVQHLWLRKS